MARSYRHIQQYEKQILEMKESGLTKREIGKRLGFTKEQIHIELRSQFIMGRFKFKTWLF